ncbi:MAG: type II toxin-antitoxin system VapC family toxin [Thermoanaerobaculia bacterium]
MIGLDTNVVVRLMIEDDETQARRARRLLDEAAERDEPVFISDIVLSELEWVLDSAYQVPRHRILAAVNALAGDTRFCFEDQNRVTSALGLYQRGKGDLADYLLGLQGEKEGAQTTFTFDRALRGDARFTLLRS